MPLLNPVPVFDFTVVLTNATPSSGPTSALGATAGEPSTVMIGTFAEVSGLNAEMETEEYREGGRNIGPHKFIKWGKYPNLVFKRGVTPNTDIWDWYYQVLYGSKAPLRKNGFILLSDRGSGITAATGGSTALGLPVLDKLPIAIWFFQNGLPEKLQGPGLNAKTNEIAIETLEIAHEGLMRIGLAMIPGVGDALAPVGV